jgi:hypothetical protein
MRFYIHSGNHNSHHGIGDTVLFLKNALQDCGHTACISHTIVPGHVNIVMEHFVKESHLRALLDGHAAGARFILIGTEPIVGGSFNSGIDGSHWHYSNSDYWTVRFDAFKAALALADGVWVLAESMLPAYSQLFPRAPVRFLPHGYVNDFATVRQRPEEERDIDFYFSGSLTDHRKRILATLNSTHKVTLDDANSPEYLRQDHLSRAKVCLSLRLSPQNVIPSVSRMHYHLQNQSFLLQEKYALDGPLDPFVMHAPAGDIVPWAISALELPNRREIAEAMHQRFKVALPMRDLLPPLLDEVIERVAPARETRVAQAV